MTVRSITASDALSSLDQFSAIIDARSPGEFAEDHLPNAQNWPSLDNDERREVGTDYKQVGGFEAKKAGAALVARNVAEHIEKHVQDKPATWKPLVYCWRGGKRSGTLAWFLDQIGFEVSTVQGGYKAFRAALVDDLAALPQRFNFFVVCGKTGTGKTRMLHALAAAGQQVLDLEHLAQHRGSVLGWLPNTPQPSQKRFDTLVWQTLASFDPAKPVWVEAESKKVGNLQVPADLLARMREHGQCVALDLSLPERVKLLLDEYRFFVDDPDSFCSRVAALTQHCGRAVVEQWQAQARAGDLATPFEQLMTQHYDPIYSASMQRNFHGFAQAAVVRLKNSDLQSFEASVPVFIDFVATKKEASEVMA